MTNLEIVQRGYQSFAEGNVPAVLEMFAPDIHWQASKGFPYFEGDALFVGHEAVVNGVFAQIPEQYDNFNIEIDELLAFDDRVIMVGHYIGNWRATCREFRANTVHLWTLEDGLCTRFFQAADTAEIIGAS